MSFELRDYQQKAVDSVFEYWHSGKSNPLVLTPTGTGKSIIVAGIIKKCFDLYGSKMSKILVITHCKELIEQDYNACNSYWTGCPSGIYSASVGRKEHIPKVIFCGVQSIRKNLQLFGKVNLCIVDEAHLIPPKATTSYQFVFSKLKEVNPKMKIVGLTATDGRADKGSVLNCGVFDGISLDLTDYDSFEMFFKRGMLCEPITKSPQFKIDLSNLKIKMGEYVHEDLSKAFDNDYVTQRAIQESLILAEDRKKIMVFCIDRKHCENVTNYLKSLGETATFIDGTLDKREREQRILDFKNGKYRFMVNISILATGFDEKAIDCLIFLRAIATSRSLYVQSVGRGLRPHPSKKNCLVLDFGRNIERLGAINERPEVQVKGNGKREGKGQAPVKVCPKCLTYNSARAVSCSNCGYEFPKNTKLMEQASIQEIIRKRKADANREYAISNVEYTKIKTKNGEQLLVTYYCGIQSVAKDWVNIGSQMQYIRDIALNWVNVRNKTDYVPKTTQELLVMCKQNKIKKPKSIEIQNINGYNRITKYIDLE